VVRLAEFGAFVELFPGTDGLLHISEIAEHRVKEVKDELREGDQVMVKVLAIEGNRIKLSRKALIREQKAKLAQQSAVEAGPVEAAPAAQAPAQPKPRAEFEEKQPRSNQSTILIEGGEDFDEDETTEEFDEDNEPNFNRVEGAPVPAGQVAGVGAGGGRPSGGGGQQNNRRRRRRRGGRPGGGQG
jgi:polyribonucleotide nucleotidyltransferase